jgi:CheY-like chemotaxis protein
MLTADRAATILLLDDDAGVLRAHARQLRAHQVTTASSVDEALAACATQQFDLILSDIRMPVRMGTDLYDALAPSQQQRVVFLTGAASDDILNRLRDLGVPVLAKPLPSGALSRLAVAAASSLPELVELIDALTSSCGLS